MATVTEGFPGEAALLVLTRDWHLMVGTRLFLSLAGDLLEALVFLLFPDAMEVPSGSEFQKLSLDPFLTLAGGCIWDQCPAAFSDTDTTGHSRGTLKTPNGDVSALSWQLFSSDPPDLWQHEMRGEGSEGTNSPCSQLSPHFFPILAFQVAASLPFFVKSLFGCQFCTEKTIGNNF